MGLREIHDELLRQAPAGAAHVAEECPLCGVADSTGTGTPVPQTAKETEGGAMSDTFTEEDVKAEVAKAVAALEAQIADLRSSQAEENLKAEIAKAIEAKDADIAALQAQLDTAVLEAEKAKSDHAELVSLLEQAQADAERAAEIAARKDERLTKVREVASFPEEYLTANADRWAAMADEDFTVLCADYSAVSEKKSVTETTVPVETAMESERVPAPVKGNDHLAASKAVMTSALRGVDFSTL